jgi:hypothetical protein
MRSEQTIFDDLATLCTSPGYAHAIAYFCFRDNIIHYDEEVTPEDMQHLFSITRLIRTETSTLIGLLIKKDIDYALPPAAVLQQYLERTETLLEEMHQAIAEHFFAGLNPKQAVEEGSNPFSRGEALREPIFYCGESAYVFQYHDFSPRKYAADDEWLKANRGFTILAARDVVHAVGKLQTERLSDTIHALRHVPPDEWTLLPGFSFTLQELSEASGIDRSVSERVLAAFTVPEGPQNQNFRSLHDFNITNAMPLLRIRDGEFVLFG